MQLVLKSLDQDIFDIFDMSNKVKIFHVWKIKRSKAWLLRDGNLQVLDAILNFKLTDQKNA